MQTTNTREKLLTGFLGGEQTNSHQPSGEAPRFLAKTPLRVFLVDDSPLIMERLNALLVTVEGVQIIGAARTAGAAIRGIQHLTPDLVILDFQLPDGTGTDVLKAIRAGQHAPLTIMLTNCGDAQYRVRCLRWGVDYWFDKSQDFERVIETCRQLSVEKALRSEERKNVSESNQPSRKCKGQCSAAFFPQHVLIVEDEEANRWLTASLLEQKGCHVRTAPHGQDALAALTQDTFDLILMDLQMPLMDGLTTTQIIRQQEGKTGLHVPIIVLTADTSTNSIQRCWQAGIDGFLAKPIQIETFYRTIEAVATLHARLSYELEALPVFDHTAALSQAHHSVEALQGAAEMFFSTSQHLLAALRRAAAKNDHANLDFAAHRLKGAASPLVACRIIELAERLELMGSLRNLSEAPATVLRLETELALFKTTYTMAR